MRLSRRTFFRAGALGAGALVAAGAYGAWKLRNCTGHGGALSPEGRALFAAMAPAFLDGVVAPAAWTPASMNDLLDQIEHTIAGLATPARRELQQLACLLDQGGARLLLAGTISPWSSVSPERARRILQRWRFSSAALLVSAYQALHDITFATWYAQPAHWAATGYPGPPSLTGGTP